jgi:hypothetical protein
MSIPDNVGITDQQFPVVDGIAVFDHVDDTRLSATTRKRQQRVWEKSKIMTIKKITNSQRTSMLVSQVAAIPFLIWVKTARQCVPHHRGMSMLAHLRPEFLED